MYTLRFGLNGTAIEFSTDSKPLIEEVLTDFGRYETDLQPKGSMSILRSTDFPISVPEFALRQSSVPPGASIYISDYVIYLEEKANRIMRIDPEMIDITGFCHRPEEHSTFIRFSLKWMLIKAMEREGIAYIHGSGVKLGDESYFFTGPTGFGKTRNLVNFLRHGGNLITDDTIFYSDGYVTPFQIRSKILKDVLEYAPELRAYTESSINILDIGWIMDLTTLYPYEVEKLEPSKLFYIIPWNSSTTKIQKVKSKEMLSRLLGVYRNELNSSIWFKADRKTYEMTFKGYDNFVDKVECYNAYVGKDTEKAYMAMTGRYHDD
mgnify:CR=1 FL=1